VLIGSPLSVAAKQITRYPAPWRQAPFDLRPTVR